MRTTAPVVLQIFLVALLQSLHAIDINDFLFFGYYTQVEDITCPLENYHETINELPLCGESEIRAWHNSKNFTAINYEISVKNYSLKFEFNENLKQYCGRSKITLKAVHCDAPQKIAFYSKELQLLGTAFSVITREYDGVASANNEASGIAYDICTLDNDKGLHMVNFHNQLDCEQYYNLDIIFKGTTSQQNKGIYKVSSDEISLQQNSAVMTQFQPNYAREAFPCFDDPNIKSTFELNLVHSSTYRSYSNTPISRMEELPDNIVSVYFEKTPRMSTYFLAFAINNLSSVSMISNTTNQIKISFFCPDALRNRAQHILTVVNKALAIMETITNIPYTLKKLDITAVTGKSYEVAMENWGLIAFSASILSQQGVHIIAEKVIHVTIHETVHQWFGNLVTPKSWSHAWLSEGMTTYFEDYIIKKNYNAQNNYNYIEDSSLQYDIIMDIDQKARDYPLVLPELYHEEYPKHYFNLRTYFKGSIIMRMLAEVVGEQNFTMFIRRYFREFSYKSIETNNFIDLLNRTFESPNINNMIQSWTFNPGFVRVFVSLLDVAQKNLLQITYTRFIRAAGRNLDAGNDESQQWEWVVPIYYKVKYENRENFTTGILWLNQSIQYFTMEGPISWIMINQNRIGLYVSTYDGNLWNKLIDMLINDVNALTVTEKNTIIVDVIRLMQNYDISPASSWKLMGYVQSERNMLLFKNIVRYMEEIATLYGEVFLNYKAVYKQFFTLAYTDMAGSFAYNETGLLHATSLKHLIVEKCVQYQCPKVTDNLKNTFSRLMTNQQFENTIDMGFYKNVFFAVAMYGNVSELELLKTNELIIRNYKLLKEIDISLSHVQNQTTLLKYLNDSFYGDFILISWLKKFLKIAASTQTGRYIVWNFVKQNWGAIAQKFHRDRNILSELLTDVAIASKSPNIIQEVTELYTNNSDNFHQQVFQELIQLLTIKERSQATYNQ